MIRFKPIKDAARADLYYSKSDSGVDYYLGGEGLHREWGGKAAAELGLSGHPEQEQFSRLIRGLDPHSGEQLTARLNEGRICAWDVTASVPKAVTMLIERGDSRVRDLVWAANRRAMTDLESYATTRVRIDGRQEDRKTGNLIWYSDAHAETRPVIDASLPEGHKWRLMPDPDFHIHNVVMNLNQDEAEDGRWKAVKFRPIMDLRKYFDRRFDHYVAGMLADAGYEIETLLDEDGRYHTWTVKDVPAAVLERHSRRSAEIGELEGRIVDDRKREHGDGVPDRLSAVARDLLGSTSRHTKRDDLTLADYRAFWDSRLSDGERRAIADTIERARLGQNPRPGRLAESAVAFSLAHHFERASVVSVEQLAITAMERSMGGASPAEIDAEIRRQGVLVEEIDGRKMATTAKLQAEERYLVGVARPGRGVVPIGVPDELEQGRLNDGQFKAVCGLLASPNRVNVIQGPAGAGKSSLLAAYDQAMQAAGESVTYLATTAKATEVLQKDGFDAHTLARFLVDERMHEAAKGGRVVVDEASMLGHADAVKFFRLAETLDLKLIFVGDPYQHGSVARGSFLKLMSDYAQVKPFTLTQIMRQEGAEYRAAAKLLSEGKTVEGFDAIDRLGWIKEEADDALRLKQIAAEYRQALADKATVLVVSPTHKEAKDITDAIRSELRQAGTITGQEREFVRLVSSDATQAERGDAATYRNRAGNVIQFHQAAKGYQKGERLTIGEAADVPLAEAGKFQLYEPEAISLAAGDRIRFTATTTLLGDGTKRLTNGMVRTVAGFDRSGNIRLAEGGTIARDAGHFRHAWVETSFGSQGQTVKRVILGMAAFSSDAMNQEQIYVSASRGKERLTIFTDDKESIRESVQTSSRKLVALDLQAKPAKPERPGKLQRECDSKMRLVSLGRVRNAWEKEAASAQAAAARARELAARQAGRRAGDGYGR